VKGRAVEDQDNQQQPTWLDLYDYRRHVASMYQQREAALRSGADELATLQQFRAQKDALFAHHPQSALNLEQRQRFTGLSYFPYDSHLRVEATFTPEAASEDLHLDASGPHAMRFQRAGHVSFSLENTPLTLWVYWIDVYGGGLFLPFRDTTCGPESYGGGRYLFDTVKGSDFIAVEPHGAAFAEADPAYGYAGGQIVLDFNYAYNPSCAYDERWVCPLAPSENRLPIPIRAGERKFHE
jgi:uncharacterized protein (DUF1684 family)